VETSRLGCAARRSGKKLIKEAALRGKLVEQHFGLDSSKFSQKILDRPLQISKLVVSGLRETANRRVIGRTGAELFKPWTFSPLGRSRRDERLDRLANLVDHPGE
jgi:hypothetical protein